jgi:hypothetical protein
MSSPLAHATVRTVAELRAVLADYPDELAVQTECSLSILIWHRPAEPADELFDAVPERLEILDPDTEAGAADLDDRHTDPLIFVRAHVAD